MVKINKIVIGKRHWPSKDFKNTLFHVITKNEGLTMAELIKLTSRIHTTLTPLLNELINEKKVIKERVGKNYVYYGTGKPKINEFILRQRNRPDIN